MNAGKKEIARPVVQHLCGMAHDEQGAAWWSLRANTPFHGWGRWGQVETTAVALSAVAKWRQVSGADASIDALIDRAILFLLKNADSSGAWATTQATIRTLDALLDVWPGVERNKASSIDVLVNGVRAGTVALPAANEVGGPVTLDISRFGHGGGATEITFAGAASHST